MPKQVTKYVFFGGIILYFLLALINLSTLPVAWTDEVQNLAPAVEYLKTGHWKAPMWPNPGAEKLFASYLPLSNVLHIVWLKLVGISIFKARLLFYFIYLVFVVFLYKYFLKNIKLTAALSLFLISIFLLDKVNFEISRSMRSEVLELLLIIVYLFYFDRKYIANLKNSMLSGSLLGLMLICHLKIWPVVFILFVYYNIQQRKVKFVIIQLIFMLLPMFIWLLLLSFQWQTIYEQLWLQGEKHAQGGGLMHRIYDHFIGRFQIYWPDQIIMPFVYLIAFCISIFNWKKWQLVHLLFLGTFLSWMFILQPHHRYSPILNLFAFAVLAIFFTSWKSIEKWKPVYFIGVLVMCAVPFASRHALALAERESRDPDKFLHFLAKNIPNNSKSLIIGNAMGFYYAANNKNLDYMLDFYPQHFQFKKYEQVYYLAKELKTGEELASYQVQPTVETWRKLIPKGKGVNYAGEKIYKIQSQEQWDSLFAKYLRY